MWPPLNEKDGTRKYKILDSVRTYQEIHTLHICTEQFDARHTPDILYKGSNFNCQSIGLTRFSLLSNNKCSARGARENCGQSIGLSFWIFTSVGLDPEKS
eukprot:sb/3478677/